MKKRITLWINTVIYVNPKDKYQKSLPVKSPVIFFNKYVKNDPKKTPIQTLSCAYEPSVPDIYVGASYFIMSGASALNTPTQNPWQSLKKMSDGYQGI